VACESLDGPGEAVGGLSPHGTRSLDVFREDTRSLRRTGDDPSYRG